YSAEDGTEKWPPVDLAAEAEQSAGGEAPRYLDVDTTPVIDDVAPGAGASRSATVTTTVFLARYAGGVVAVGAETGTRLSSNDKVTGVTEVALFKEPPHAPTPGGPYSGGPMVPAFSMLIASSGTTGLWGLDPATGRSVWRLPVPEGGITAP